MRKQMTQQMTKFKNLLTTILKFAVVGGAFAFLIGTDQLNFSNIRNTLHSPILVLAGIFFTLLPMLISFWRYHYLLKAVEIDLGLPEVCRLGFISCFFGIFMPGSMGGDLVKVAYIMRDTGKRAPVIASAMVDRVLGLLGMILLGGGAMLWALDSVMATPSLHKLAVAIFSTICVIFACGLTSVVTLLANRWRGLLCWLAVSLLCGWGIWRLSNGIAFAPIQHPGETVDTDVLMRSRIIVALLCSQLAALPCILIVPSCQPGRSLARFISLRIPFGNKLMSFVEALLAYRNSPGAVLFSLLLSLVTHGTNMLSLYFFARAAVLPHMPSLQDIFFASPLAYIANSLPVPGGGLGVGETAFAFLLDLCRTPEGARITGGAAVFLIWRFWYIALSLIGLPFYLKGKKKILEAEEDYFKHEHDDEICPRQ